MAGSINTGSSSFDTPSYESRGPAAAPEEAAPETTTTPDGGAAPDTSSAPQTDTAAPAGEVQAPGQTGDPNGEVQGPPAPKQDEVKLSEDAGKPEAANPVNFGSWGTMKQGSRGDDVRELQEQLNKTTGSHLATDGIFGRDTAKAVKQFQDSKKLDDDGIVGKNTRQAFAGGGAADPAGAGKAAAGTPAAGGTKGADVKGADPTAAAKQAAAAGDPDWASKLPPKLRAHAQDFINAGKKYNVDPRLLASISMQETGNGSSSAFRNKNNAMGISGTGGPKRFSSVDASINQMAKGLANPNGYYKGKTTIAGIGGVYAPVGAANDPRGLNQHWIPNISRNYRSLGGDPTGQVIFR